MRTISIPLLFLCCGASWAGENPILDSMDQMTFRLPKEKGKAELIEGKSGKAIQFHFDQDSRSIFFMKALRGTPAWDQAAGFSFWVKGDGSAGFGGLQFIYNDDFAVRYDHMFPISSTDWTKITVAWQDLIPVLPGPKAKLLNPAGENRPSRLSALWFGKWWYWGSYPAYAFAVDDIQLETKIESDPKDYQPAGPPLGRVLAKLQAGKPITIVTMGDSLTDFKHWANRKVSWPTLLRDKLKEKYKSEVTIINPAIGGTQLRQNLVLMPRWLAQAPAPDLVTVAFGYNDWDAGMRGPQFFEAYADAIPRIRWATKGQADVLILTTTPAAGRWETMSELAQACRKAAQVKNAGLADTEKAFHTAGQAQRERLYGFDKTHLSPAGHEVVVEAVLQALQAR